MAVSPDPRDVSATATRPQASPERAAVAGLLANFALATIKLVAGVVGHAFALVADAIESIADIVGSLVVWQALRYGAKPPDESHPFGHGKAESLGALAVCMLIVLAGVWIAVQSFDGIVNPHETPRWYTLVVLVVVIVTKAVMYRVTHRAARTTQSSAGFADAGHHRSDAITSAAAFVGIAVALIGGPAYAAADDWAALLASGVILVNGLRLARAPLAELMDEAAPDIAAECTAIALGVDGIRAVEQCEARKVGRAYRVVMHAEMDPDLTVAAAHALTGQAKAIVRERLPLVSSLLIHVEPHGDDAPPTGERRSP